MHSPTLGLLASGYPRIPTLGRFMQTDPIGDADGIDWYNCTGGDPVNNVEPSGTSFAGLEPLGEDEYNGPPTDVIASRYVFPGLPGGVDFSPAAAGAPGLEASRVFRRLLSVRRSQYEHEEQVFA
jgi:hypothetical protein